MNVPKQALYKTNKKRKRENESHFSIHFPQIGVSLKMYLGKFDWQ